MKYVWVHICLCVFLKGGRGGGGGRSPGHPENGKLLKEAAHHAGPRTQQKTCLEVLGGAWRCLGELGGGWRSLEELGGVWRCFIVAKAAAAQKHEGLKMSLAAGAGRWSALAISLTTAPEEENQGLLTIDCPPGPMLRVCVCV